MSVDSFTARFTIRNQDPDNPNTFTIRRNPSFEFYNEEVSLTKAHIPNTFHSVTDLLSNNRFSYQLNGQTNQVVLPNGNHTIESINGLLPAQIQLSVDPITKLVKLNTTNGAQLVIPSGNKFGQLIGFAPGTYSSGTGTTIPKLNTIGVCNINLNIINTTISSGYVSWNCIETFLPRGEFGDIIDVIPSQPNWMRILDGTYDFISVSLTDDNNQPLRLLDPRVYIELEFRKNDLRDI